MMLTADCSDQGLIPDQEAGPGCQEDHEVPATLQTQVSLHVCVCDCHPSAAHSTGLNTPSGVPQDQRVEAEPGAGEERNYHLDL